MKRGYSISAKFYKIKETTKCVFVWIGKINWIIVIVIELASTVRWEGGGQGGARWGGCEMDEGEVRGDEGKRWFDVMRGECRESLWGESVVWCVRWVQEGGVRLLEWGWQRNLLYCRLDTSFIHSFHTTYTHRQTRNVSRKGSREYKQKYTLD